MEEESTTPGQVVFEIGAVLALIGLVLLLGAIGQV